MPRESPFTIHLSRKERETLEGRARKYTLPYCEVLRAKMQRKALTPNDFSCLQEVHGSPAALPGVLRTSEWQRPSVERRVVSDASAFVGESVRLAVRQVC
jgi:hypothetical protein